MFLGSGATWYFAFGGKATLDGAAGSPTSTASVSANEKEAADATKALRKLTTDPKSLVPDDQKRTVTIADAVPKGSIIHVSQKSWAPASKSSGTLVATLSSPGLDDATYLVSMMKEDGKWVVVGTLPVTE
ncbi:hypothetical protein FHW23_000079 [Curtobacterium pusillum]|uniref:DUF4878 domain-containing protein n=1 Tax=Curtobacterium pusillum TaxID=69373 RepID=A0AAW3T2N7_9MICO|nr:hypothetical protein [Curtobacterium pusillum]MBA8988847.1 hypothetical protein [Curtobacterium pusillum]